MREVPFVKLGLVSSTFHIYLSPAGRIIIAPIRTRNGISTMISKLRLCTESETSPKKCGVRRGRTQRISSRGKIGIN